jgi:WhiB family transcriptional regulator, redox-sensing transcriptional regulator
MYNFTEQANCAGIDVDMFFTKEGTSTFQEEAFLRRICAACPVKSECLDYALHHSVLGWWGGTSEIKRKKLRRQLNIIPEPVIVERVTL